MNSISQAFETSKTRSQRIYRWVSAWLSLSAVIALLLLANSIRDYRFVSNLIAREQVRHKMSQHAAALEHQLRQIPIDSRSNSNPALDDSDHSLWIELRGPDGKVITRAGQAAQRPFSDEQERTQARDHEPLYAVVSTSAGDTVVEVFPLHVPFGPRPASTPPVPNVAEPNAPTPLMLEIAMPLSAADPSIFWPIRRNLFINCSGAMALLVTIVIAGMGFRSYARGKHLEEQLEIARQVQSELLPRLTEKFAGVQLATEYKPAEQVGGDFYDVFRLKNDGLALVMGDVSGKGMPAALLMGVIHGSVRSSAWAESATQHESESQKLNQLLCERASGERYASMFWCYHDPTTRSLHYVNAGHCPPLMARTRDGKIEVSRLHEGGPVLGVLPEAGFQQIKRDVSVGDILVLYSDGLVETTNNKSEEYGENRLRDLLVTITEKGAGDVRRAILSSLAAFSGATDPADDLTILVVKFLSPDS